MPKKMFYKIPVEKQEMFINAAIDEFTSKSFENTSVNSIIKKANISRGSFYNYFEDIEQLFNFIFVIYILCI
jgi:AcrR family transcriptional regulator